MRIIEFGAKADADAAREQASQFLDPDDDRRLKTVKFGEDLPEPLEDRLRADADAGFAARESGPGQEPLTADEKRRLGPFTGKNNILKARSVKAMMQEAGVSDWTSYYDPTITVDEHRSSVLPMAIQDGGGARDDGRNESARRQQERASQTERFYADHCRHAEGACQNGNIEACEALAMECGLSEEEVSEVLGAPFGDADEPTDAAPDVGELELEELVDDARISEGRARTLLERYGSLEELALAAIRDKEELKELEDVGSVTAWRVAYWAGDYARETGLMQESTEARKQRRAREMGLESPEEGRKYSDDDRQESDDEPDDELVTVGGDGFAEMQVTPATATALRQSWTSYKAGFSNVFELISELRSEIIRTRQAMKTINSIRKQNGQQALEPERLNESLDVLEGMPANIPRTRTLEEFGGEA